MANLTQAELAQKLGVSKRTVVNWEREGSVVPARSEHMVRNALGVTWGPYSPIASAPALDSENGAHDVSGDGPGYEFVFEGWQAQDPGAATAMGDVLASLNLADWASRYRTDPTQLVSFLEALANMVINTGLSAIPVPGEYKDLLAKTLGESHRILTETLGDYPRVLEDLNANPPFARVSFKSYQDSFDRAYSQWRANSVGGSGEDVDPGEAAATPGDPQDGYGLAAKERSKNRGEVDYD